MADCQTPRSFVCKLNTYSISYPDEGVVDENKKDMGEMLDCEARVVRS